MRTALALAALLAAAPAHSTVVTYQLTGTSLDACDEWSARIEDCQSILGVYGRSGVYDGFIHIDESLLDAPIAGRTLNLFIPDAPGPGEHNAFSASLGVMHFRFGHDAHVSLTVDENRHPLSWSIFVANAPDYSVSNDGSFLSTNDWVAYGAAGTLRLHAIDGDIVSTPLPAALWLMLAGVSGMAALRRGWP